MKKHCTVDSIVLDTRETWFITMRYWRFDMVRMLVRSQQSRFFHLKTPALSDLSTATLDHILMNYLPVSMVTLVLWFDLKEYERVLTC
jgi:hypothetical protein